MNYSKTIGLIFTILVTSFAANAQLKAELNEKPKDNKAVEVLTLAKQAIYKSIDSIKIKSIYFETKGTLVADSVVEVEGDKEPRKTKSRINIEESTSINLPDKVKHTVVTHDAYTNPIENFTKITMTLNSDNIFFDTEKVVNGKVFDLNAVLNSATIPEASKKQLREQQEKAKAAVTRDTLIKTVAGKILPYLLYNPWQKDSFIYVGKAIAGETRADVLEMASSSDDKQTRLFFDEKTHLLLMITQEVKRKDATIQSSYYFKDYQLKSGVLIAKTINFETNSTVKQKVKDKNVSTTTKVVYEITTEEFKVNSLLNANIFIQAGFID